MHTLRWNPDVRRWVVEFVVAGRSHVIATSRSGQDAVDLVNCLNGGQPVGVTEKKPGTLRAAPPPSLEELQKQMTALEAQNAGATDATTEGKTK
jgi:hypothetical protein